GAALGSLHALLMVAFPDVRPGSVEDVRHAVFEYLARRHWCGFTFHGKALRDAFHEGEGVAFVAVVLTVKQVHDTQWLGEGFLVVENHFVMQAHQFAPLPARRVDFDRLQAIAELEAAVGNPALDVRGPGYEGFAVPEADGFAKPLRHVRTETRHHAAFIECTTDVDLRDQG